MEQNVGTVCAHGPEGSYDVVAPAKQEALHYLAPFSAARRWSTVPSRATAQRESRGQEGRARGKHVGKS